MPSFLLSSLAALLPSLICVSYDRDKTCEHANIVLVSASTNAEELIVHGRILVNERRFSEAITEFKKAIELDPKHMNAYIELARAYLFSNAPDLAETTLKQALIIDPQSTEILVSLGDFYVMTGKPDQGEASYKQALDTDQQNEQIYLRLASLYQRYNKFTEAETTLRKLAAVKPQAENPHIYMGDYFTWLGQPDKALDSYQRAIEINPGSVFARDKIISNLLDRGKTSEAETKVKEILAKNNRDLMGRFFDAKIRMIKGNSDEAISLLQGIIKDEPQFALAHHLLGIGYMRKGETAQARAAFQEGIKLNPNLSESRTALAQLYLLEGSADLAIEQAQAAIQLNPRNVTAALISGDAYLLKGDLAKSRQVFEAISQALPKDPIGPYRLGVIDRAEKQNEKALSHFEEALSRKPAAIEPLAQIAMIKIVQGKSTEARDRVTKQIQAFPNNPLLYTLLGQLWMTAKDNGQAEVAFKKAIELDNSLLTAYINLAQVYHQTGKIEQAMKEYQAVLVKDPKLIQAHMLLAIMHDGRKEYTEAETHYAHALKLDAKFAPAANNLAWLQAERGGNLDVALSYAQTAREQRPDDPHIADTLGWIYYKKHSYRLATNLLKEAVEKLANEPLIQYHYGMSQYRNGDARGAKKSLEMALKLNQHFPGSEEAKNTLAGL